MSEKGTGRTMHKMMAIIGSVAFLAILLAIVNSLLLEAGPERRDRELEGGEYDVLRELQRLTHRCWEENENLQLAKVCYEINTNINEKIYADNIHAEITNSNLLPENLDIPQNLTEETEKIIIKYESNVIYIEER